MGLDGEAKFEYDSADRIRKEKQWFKKRRAPDFYSWSKNVDAVQSNEELYARHGARADDLVLDKIPHLDGVLLARYLDATRKRQMVKVWWHNPSEEKFHQQTIEAPEAISGKPIGTPLRVWPVKYHGELRIPKIELRQNAPLWDGYPRKTGVLISHDPVQGRSWFSVEGMRKSCVADWIRLNDLRNVPLGTLFNLAIVPRKDGRQEVCHYSERGGTAPLPDFVKKFSGTITIPERKSFALVDDVYIPERVLSDRENGQKVAGIAFKAIDRYKNNRESWKAIAIEDL